MQRFNPTASPFETIASGLVLEGLHDSLYKNLAARADLEPGSQQLLVGGIGSGKTTELLLAEAWLKTGGETASFYIDITAETDLSRLNAGALLAGFGRRLHRRFFNRYAPECNQVQLDELQNAAKKIEQFALGKTESVWVPYDDPLEEPPDDNEDEAEPGYFRTYTLPGKLQPPFPAIKRDIGEIRALLKRFLDPIRNSDLDVIVLLDGLDRLIAPDRFWSVVEQDFRVFRELRVSVLGVAPISVLYGKGRSVSEHFDRVHHLPALSVDLGQLQTILDQRGGMELLGVNEAHTICKASGGVLRDLISLARDAGEEAYVHGAHYIRPEDVRKVVWQLGNAYLRGLGAEHIMALNTLEKKGSFDLSQDINVELLATRRVLEYSSTEFRIHPALMPLLASPEARIA